MDRDKKLIMKNLSEDKVNALLKAWFRKDMKSSQESCVFREKGNLLYSMAKHSSQDHEKIWKFYSLSIAKAPNLSENLAIAYGNRSALLFHLKKYKECISDIDRALKITNSVSLKTKLLTRKNKCLSIIESFENEASLEKNEMLLSKLNINKKELIELSNFDDHSSKSSLYSSNDAIEIQELLSRKKACDSFELVSLRHNERYGRHLIANQDIKPGEIIMVVEPFIKCVNLNNIHAFCSHCMKTCWASIPCDECSSSMYCSKECKNEAWEKYHDIECNVIPYIMWNHASDYWKQLALRLVIIAIRETGSIAKLKEYFKKFDSCNDKLRKGFVNGKLSNNHFASIFSLSCDVSSDVLEKHVDHATITLVVLAKSTSLFGDSNKFICGEDIASNEEAVFVGSLLLRMLKISDINAHCVMEGSSLCRFSFELKECEVNRCCERGVCLTTIPSMVNHSCNPNIRKCYTEDMHMIVYALQPIKKNSQLFDSYVGYFFEKSISERQLALENFNFECTCPACKNEWPTILLSKNYYPDINKISKEELKLFEKYKNFIHGIDNEKIQYTWRTIKSLSKDITVASAHLNQPSYITAWLISTLWTAIDNVFGIKLQIPSSC